MKIKRIEIKNFRSIKDQSFTFDRNFQILVGINESGKTNLLKAVSLLNEQIEFNKDDVRDPGHDEDAVKESYVRFVFQLDSWIKKKIYNDVKSKVLTIDNSKPLLDIDDKPYNLRDFCYQKDEVLYIINFLKETRSTSHWRISGPKYRIYPEWKKVTSGASHAVHINGKPVNISSYSIVNTNDFDEIPEQFIENLDISSLNSIVGEELTTISEEYFPTCIVWDYSDDKLLPSKINLSQFTSNPNICIPLKNMFSLAGHHDATKALQSATQKTNGLRNILRKVSKNTTTHMKKVWPEWKNQKVSLYQNGDFIEAGIEDEYNIYSLARRSDGFKRFFTFLLMISVQNKTEEIYDNLIVIDEPDTGLHPTGVQYLRDELRKIGTHNLVLVSTHSIFMIDKEIINRHLIIEKKNEITHIKRVSVSNMNDEEVVYKALGYSLFELLKSKNIIFEGWRDKRTFETLLRSRKGGKIIKKSKLLQIGLLHSMGVKDIQRVANTCENFSREYVIISDSDKPAKEKQRIFTGTGKWFCYNDIAGIDALTTEDFFSNSLLNRAIKHVFKECGIETELTIDNTVTKGKLFWIEKEIKRMGITSISVKEVMNQLKEYACINAKASDFNEQYYDVGKFIMEQEIFA